MKQAAKIAERAKRQAAKLKAACALRKAQRQGMVHDLLTTQDLINRQKFRKHANDTKSVPGAV